ncbi:B2 bradykinin receptor-like isoform X2 [Sphaeramia orbicularis]|uniref:B2 bradykinin receptor-like isoform X2 n=1 Tax=Sphaeramia orbicularis TaxID=375764 RepID=UPI00117FEA71|nr:B2 bradykinin receptor-like isoform X2 [Sphaeramia orbicularis]
MKICFPVNITNTTINEDLVYTSNQCPETEIDQMIYTVVPVYLLIISVLGIVLNILVLLVFWLHKNPCTEPEIYLSNMAAADLLLMCFLLFWAATVANKYNWFFGALMCQMVNFCIVVNANCSIYFLVLVSIDRFLALVHPLSNDRIRSRKCARLGCVLVWCFGLSLGIPTLMCRKVKDYPQFNFSSCSFDCSETVFYTNEVVKTMFGFIIPVAIISYCTVKIIQALKNRSVESARIQKMEHKATFLVLVVLGAFLICWAPFQTLRIIENFLRTGIIPGNSSCEVVRVFDICMHTFNYLAFFNSVLNPILYVIVGKNFRTKMREVSNRYCTLRQNHHPHD